MAYTTADLTAVDAAIMKIVAGQREVQVKYGDMQVTYSDVEIDKLRALRSFIQSDIAGAAGRRRTSVISTRKGL